MPVLTVHQVKKSLRKAVAYIVNPLKTDNGRAVTLGGTGRWDPLLPQDREISLAVGEFEKTLAAGQGKGTVLAHHLIQSFDPRDNDRLTWRDVHEAGVALARRICGDDHQFIVATHTNKHHLHNHILIIPVSTRPPHKRMRVRKTTLAAWRAASDRIARSIGASTLPAPTDARGRSIREIYASLTRGGSSSACATSSARPPPAPTRGGSSKRSSPATVSTSHPGDGR